MYYVPNRISALIYLPIRHLILARACPEFIQSLSPVCAYLLFCRGRAAYLTRSRGMLAHVLWNLPSGVLICFSAGGRRPGIII